jgi:hypothetical protein
MGSALLFAACIAVRQQLLDDCVSLFLCVIPAHRHSKVYVVITAVAGSSMFIFFGI